MVRETTAELRARLDALEAENDALRARAEAAARGADLVLFTELFIAGYPPEDLVLKPAFLVACEEAIRDFAKDTADGGPGVVIGTPLKRASGIHNSVVVRDPDHES